MGFGRWLGRLRDRHRAGIAGLDLIPRAAREARLLRWDVKALATELARQRYAAGLAGPEAALPPLPMPIGLTSRVCRQADIEAAWLRHWCRRLHMAPLYHRKVWEDAFVLQALWEAGMLAPGHRALGFGVGQEAIPAVLAADGVTVVATDLDGRDTRAREWLGAGQHAEVDPLFRAGLVEESAFAAQVTHRAADMTAIPADLATGGFDCVWSVCALEHLGTLGRGEDFIVASMACLRPGGIAVHTTEFNLDTEGGTIGWGRTVLYQQRHMDRLAARLAAAGHTLLPIDAAPGDGLLDRFVDLPPYPNAAAPFGAMDPPHLRLALAGYPVTSVGLVIRAG